MKCPTFSTTVCRVRWCWVLDFAHQLRPSQPWPEEPHRRRIRPLWPYSRARPKSARTKVFTKARPPRSISSKDRWRTFITVPPRTRHRQGPWFLNTSLSRPFPFLHQCSEKDRSSKVSFYLHTYERTSASFRAITNQRDTRIKELERQGCPSVPFTRCPLEPFAREYGSITLDYLHTYKRCKYDVQMPSTRERDAKCLVVCVLSKVHLRQTAVVLLVLHGEWFGCTFFYQWNASIMYYNGMCT